MTGSQPEDKGMTERWYRMVLLGYPRQYRERHGGELLGTLLEAHPSGGAPSLRESASLLDTGLLTRLRGRLDPAPAWRDGLHLGLLVLALMRAGTLLGHLSSTQQQGQPLILVCSLLVVVPVLLGWMGTATVLASIAAVASTVQVLGMPNNGAYTIYGFFTSRTFGATSGVNFWLNTGLSQLWVVALGAAVLAVNRRTSGSPLRRRSWAWLTVTLLQFGCTAYDTSRLPSATVSIQQRADLLTMLTAVSVLPLLATVVLLLLALRATAVIGDPRWAIAAGVYLVPVIVMAAGIVLSHPSAIVTLDTELPGILLAAAACAVALRRRGTRRSES